MMFVRLSRVSVTAHTDRTMPLLSKRYYVFFELQDFDNDRYHFGTYRIKFVARLVHRIVGYTLRACILFLGKTKALRIYEDVESVKLHEEEKEEAIRQRQKTNL